MKPEIILVGGGGHCASCIDVIEQEGRFRISGIVDLETNLHKKVLGYEIIATDNDLPGLFKEYPYFLVCVGQIQTASKRRELFHLIKNSNVTMPVVISPRAYVSQHAQVGEGTIVMHHAVINAGATVGVNCIVNTSAIIEHDAVIGNHSHIATAAVINGGAKAGSGVFIGSNAVCREMIVIEDECIVGCGARVVRNITSGSLFK
jgi:sugar O-acyltransferase (sialic acid O-acetyltransferase NeuD family)